MHFVSSSSRCCCFVLIKTMYVSQHTHRTWLWLENRWFSVFLPVILKKVFLTKCLGHFVVNQRAVGLLLRDKEEKGGTGSSPLLFPWLLYGQVQWLVPVMQKGRKQSCLQGGPFLHCCFMCRASGSYSSSYCYQAGIAGLSLGQESGLGMQWAQLIHASAEQMSL